MVQVKNFIQVIFLYRCNNIYSGIFRIKVKDLDSFSLTVSDLNMIQNQ